jgi:hypothetical protein
LKDEICSLLGYYMVPCGNWILTFRGNVFVPSSRVRSILTVEDGTDMVLQHTGKHYHTHEALLYPGRAQISSTLGQKPEIKVNLKDAV